MPKRHERKELSRIARRQEDRTEADQQLADARERLKNAPSLLASMTPEERANLTTYSGDEVLGEMRSKRKPKRTYRLEYRVKPERWASCLYDVWKDWHVYFTHYKTAKQRDTALAAMNRKDTLFEYRVKE